MSADLDAIIRALDAKKSGDKYVAKCPAHQDDKPSLELSKPNGKVLVHCFAGCAQSDVIAALRAKGVWPDISTEKKIVATYDYPDADGKLIYQVVRYTPKDFRQRRPDDAGGWIWKMTGIIRVPYRLPGLIRAVSAGTTIYITEGEKDVGELDKIGLTATTNAGGAGKWRKEYNEYFKGANVVILPDNDDPGKAHATQVMQSLSGIAREVKIVDLPGLPPKGDVSDWIAIGGTRDELESLCANAPEPELPQKETSSDRKRKNGADGADDKKSTANELIEIALKNAELFHDERNDGYAVLVHGGIRRTLKLRGREFRRWLAGTFYAATERAANNEALATAMNVLEAKATFDGTQLQLCNRFAVRDGVIYVDMADREWRVIKVTAGGWEIMTKPPVLFRRYAHQQALPAPTRGGKLADIHRHLSIKTDDDKLLLEAWLVACAFENVPRPAIDFHGPQGASKSTSARTLKSITDPSVTDSVDLGKTPADLAQLLDHNAVPCFDNVSSVPSWAADLLCRAVTGGAFSKRELYSDDSDIILTFKRAIIITGINIPTHAPDLLDRLLLIELERIAPDKRLDEATFWKSFAADRAGLFGAVLDGIAGALKHLPTVTVDRLPRMADFAKIACAYAEYVGIGADRMIDILMRQGARQTQEVLDADPVASAVREFIRKRGAWAGTPSELLKLLNESAPTPRPEGWPKQANSLSRRLNILHSTLNEIGISVRRDKAAQGRERRIELESRPDSLSVSSLSAFPNENNGLQVDDNKDDIQNDPKVSSVISSTKKRNSINGLDDKAGQDDKSALLSDTVIL